MVEGLRPRRHDSLGLTILFNTSTMSGGTGNDTISVSKGIGSTFQGDLGHDSLYFSDSSFNNSTVYGGNTSDATSADGSDTLWISGTASSSYIHGNGGNDTIYVGGTALSSSIYGGQGVDDISVVGSISNSVVSGNLGNDTMDFTAAVNSSTIYGGGGFEYDTSLDGADSIEIAGSFTASLLHGNGGNDSFYLADPTDLKGSTVYGGQGADLVDVAAGASTDKISKSWIAGNRGDDKILLKNTGTLINSTVLGSDITGTIAGNDSLSISAVTLQTSTVYGGAGNDTIIFGGSDEAASQIIEADVRAFAGADSINAVGSFVSTTVRAGAGADTLFINTSSTSATASTATEFYGGAGADQVTVSNGFNVSIFTDDSSSDTAGGADSITLGAVTSSTVYGASGSDTLVINGANTSVYVDLGTDANRFEGAGAVASSTLIGGAANDTLASPNCLHNLYWWRWCDTFAISGVSTDCTILGAGNDTATTAKIVDGYIGGGAGVDLISASADVSTYPSYGAPLSST